MGNICPCPWFRRQKEREFAYDVHEETFQMEENPHLQIHSPQDQKNSDQINVLPDQLKKTNEAHDKVPDMQVNNRDNHSSEAFSDKQIDRREQEMNALNKAEPQPTIEQTKPPLKPQQPKQTVQQKPKSHSNILKPKAIKKKVNPDDYRFINENQTFRVKRIDSIKQQQFNIDNCKGCTYFIFDITANLYIDDTQNCFIFIAPCESTVFVRNCKNLVVVAATKQFRTYQVHNSTFSLYCKSQPVIQSSSQLVFSPFSCPFYYGQLANQLSKKRLQPWNNHWSQVHNFTKKEGEVHYLLEKNINYNQNDWQKAFQEAELVQAQIQNPIPFIVGQLPYEIKNEVLILVNKGIDDETVKNVLKGAVIVKAFQGVIAGEGKEERKAILVDALDNNVSKYEQIGKVFQAKEQISQKKEKWFINFGDEREK